MKALQNKQTFKGTWDEDCDSPIGTFKTMDCMFHVTKPQMLTALPLILHGDTQAYFVSQQQSCVDYDETLLPLRHWYNAS